MWQGRQHAALKKELEALIEPLAAINSLYTLIQESLTREARYQDAGTSSPQNWTLLPLIVCEAISGKYQRALPAAAALQLLKISAEIFDDVEDADSSESLSFRYGNPVAVNVATTFLILSEKAIAGLRTRGVADNIIIRVIETIGSYFTLACAGQHLDLSAGPGTLLSEEDYMNITAMKSASTTECACCVGALLAAENQQLVDKFADFGRNLGISSQIANDIQGITRGNDITKRKITLPVIYALNQTADDKLDQFQAAFLDPACPALDAAKIRDLLFSTGAIQYALVKMEYFKQITLDCLLGIEKMGTNVKRLKPLLN